MDDARTRFGLALAVGVLVVFFYHIGSLAGTLSELTGTERGALWAVLLMILATVLTVVVIGGGLARALRREEEPRQAGDESPEVGGETSPRPDAPAGPRRTASEGRDQEGSP